MWRNQVGGADGRNHAASMGLTCGCFGTCLAHRKIVVFSSCTLTDGLLHVEFWGLSCGGPADSREAQRTKHRSDQAREAPDHRSRRPDLIP